MHRCWAVEGRRRGDAVYLRSRLVCPMDGVQQIAGRSAAGEHIAAALVRCNPAWASQPGENAVDRATGLLLGHLDHVGHQVATRSIWGRGGLDPGGLDPPGALSAAGRGPGTRRGRCWPVAHP